jgi:ABC-type tungstate transport system permease subunit
MSPLLSRRHLLRRTGASISIAAVTLLAAGSLPAAPDSSTSTSADPSTVRLLTVGAALTKDLFLDILADFEAESGYTVTVTQGGPDIMEEARSETDIVMVHLGHEPLHEFVLEGRGLYPATVMSNTVVILAPPNDPARIKKLDDPFEAFEAIAARNSPFVVNNLGETRYITDAVYEAAGRPDPGDWFRDEGLSGPQAVLAASRQGAYTIWGLHPFLNLRESQNLNLHAIVYPDSLMQRIIATTVVNRPPGKVNREGALALQDYLTDPATQAEIRALRLPPINDHPDIDGPILWPAGNQNDN